MNSFSRVLIGLVLLVFWILPLQHSAGQPSFVLYAGTSGAGENAAQLFRMDDDGAWQQILSLSAPQGRSLRISDLAFYRDRLYAATASYSGPIFAQGLFYSTDGTNWIHDDEGPTDDVYALSVIGDRLYAGVDTGFYELGVRNGRLQWSFNQFAGGNVNRAVVAGRRWYAGTYGNGLYFSDTGGRGWSKVPQLPEDINVWTLTTFQDHAYFGTYDGHYYRNSTGQSWPMIASLSAPEGCALLAPLADQLVAAAGDDCTIYRSGNGVDWQKLEPGIGLIRALYVASQNGIPTLYAGAGSTIWRTEDMSTWTSLPPLPEGVSVSSLVGR